MRKCDAFLTYYGKNYFMWCWARNAGNSPDISAHRKCRSFGHARAIKIYPQSNKTPLLLTLLPNCKA